MMTPVNSFIVFLYHLGVLEISRNAVQRNNLWLNWSRITAS